MKSPLPHPYKTSEQVRTPLIRYNTHAHTNTPNLIQFQFSLLIVVNSQCSSSQGSSQKMSQHTNPTAAHSPVTL